MGQVREEKSNTPCPAGLFPRPSHLFRGQQPKPLLALTFRLYEIHLLHLHQTMQAPYYYCTYSTPVRSIEKTMRVTAACSLLFYLPLSFVSSSQHPLLVASNLRNADSQTDALLALHRTLVSIPSTSGNESDIAFVLKNYLEAHGLEVELQPVSPETHHAALNPEAMEPVKQRYNVFAYSPGHRQTPILLTSHIDTVPPHIPYSFRGDDELWGRGTVDAKACIATQFWAYMQLVRAGDIKRKDVSFLYVVGEETGGLGMRTANSLGLRWETVIFGEPTELKLATGHKGFLVFYLTATGAGGHSGYPELADSALDVMLAALAKLKELEAQFPSSERFGPTTLNIGMLESGVAPNVIPTRATAGVSVRVTSKDPADVKNLILETLEGVNDRLQIKFLEGMYGPVATDFDVPGFETSVVNYGTDVPNLKGDHKRYLYGPGSILVAHSDHEHLRTKDLVDAVAGYEKLIKHALLR